MNAKKYEIAAFIEPVFNDCFLAGTSAGISVQDIEILSIQDVDSNELERHALVRVYPNEVARRLLKRIDGAVFKNTRVSAREYVNRSFLNDCRNRAPSSAAETRDHRIVDRRRKPLLNSWQKDPILVHTVRA